MKLTSKIALELVEEIEALHDAIHAVYAKANEYEGINNSNVIIEAVEARKAAREAQYDADAYIESFDIEDDV